MNDRMPRAALLAAAVLAAAACGKKSQTVTMNTDAGKIAVTADSSGMALPADFPKDVPVMKDAVVNAVMGSAEQGNQMVFTRSAGPIAPVLAFYQEGFKAQGWTTGSSTNTGKGAILTLKKDGRNLMVTVSEDQDGKNTNVQFALLKKS